MTDESTKSFKFSNIFSFFFHEIDCIIEKSVNKQEFESKNASSMILKKRIKVSSAIEVNVHHRHGKEDTIICFHGFGETASIFDNLASQFPDYQYISVDLPFHGSTVFPDSHLTKKLWYQNYAGNCQYV